MLFNSFEFLVFFIIVYGLYLVLPHRWQNRMLLVASYVFYGWWDWRFLSLIFISTLLDYICGLKIEAADSKQRKKIFLIASLVGNLGLLGFFKYFNFFVGSAQELIRAFGGNPQTWHLNIILPVGISFYTFQTLSYTIDVYRGEMKPTRRFFDFALYVAFFPQLVAGPIERARDLLPQILNPRIVRWPQVKEGLFLIYWGLFEKMFVAGLMAQIADSVFAVNGSQNGAFVLIALYSFAFQIFCDFDAYSNIARGLAKCMGVDIMVNFNLPYVSRNPKEFWQRWHISLSTWLRDYLYIPLGGNHGGAWLTAWNLMITMLLGGLWHGANWTFVAWGFFHGTLLVLYRFWPAALKPGVVFGKIRPALSFVSWLIFFHLTMIGWLLFRAGSLSQAGQMFYDIVAPWQCNREADLLLLKFIAVGLPLWLVQAAQARKGDLMIVFKQHWAVQTVIYAFWAYLIIGWGIMRPEEFIYFQF